jgi:hypothetical protein
MNIRSLFIAALCWPMYAMSNGYPDFTSKIPGVQLWNLNANEAGLPEEYFEEDRNEFIKYCNGARSIYVSSFDSPIRCKSEATGEGPYRTYRIHLKATDRRLSGLVVVSKHPLGARAKSLPITTEESERLRKAEVAPMAAFANEVKRTYMKSSSDENAAAFAKMLREIKTEATYRKHGGARFKISTPNGFIYISAVGLFPDDLGWDIKNVVFREIDGELQEIGAFFGCIEGFRDLDADGTPEVLTRLCENSEGTVHTFWSLTPTVRSVVTRSQ